MHADIIICFLKKLNNNSTDNTINAIYLSTHKNWVAFYIVQKKLE